MPARGGRRGWYRHPLQLQMWVDRTGMGWGGVRGRHCWVAAGFLHPETGQNGGMGACIGWWEALSLRFREILPGRQNPAKTSRILKSLPGSGE